jgi:hypothetical protein
MRQQRLARLGRQARVQGALLTVADLAYLTSSVLIEQGEVGRLVSWFQHDADDPGGRPSGSDGDNVDERIQPTKVVGVIRTSGPARHGADNPARTSARPTIRHPQE